MRVEFLLAALATSFTLAQQVHAETVPPRGSIDPRVRVVAYNPARGRGFPTCNLAIGPNGRSYATPISSVYDACPTGTSELPVEQYAELFAPISAPPTTRSGAPSLYTPASMGLTYAGIGDGRVYGYGSRDNPAPAKVCVAGYRGNRRYRTADTAYQVAQYETIYVMNAVGGRAVNVYIDDALWQTVRW